MSINNADSSSDSGNTENSGDIINISPTREDFAQDFGTYHQKVLSIRSELNLNKAVDLTSDASKYLNIWDFHGGENQQWNFVYDSMDRAYEIISISTRKAIKSNADGSITMVNPTGSFEAYDYGAYWQLLKISNTNYYLIKNMASGMLLDLDNANTANGTRIKTFRENGEIAQYWELFEIGQTIGEFDGKIVSLHTELDWNKALDYDRDQHDLQMWDYNAGNNQQWRLKYNSTTRAYQIISIYSGNCLAANSSGNLTLTLTDAEYGNSYWKVVQVKPYTCYTIENLQYGTCLDVAGSDTANGHPVIAYAKNGNTNQLWRLFENRMPDFDIQTVVIRMAEQASQCIDLQYKEGTINSPTTEIVVFTYREGDNQHWELSKNGNDTYQILSNYIYNPSGEVGGDSRFWIVSNEATPSAPNTTLSFLEGGESRWRIILMPGLYDYDGRARYAIESASRPGNFLKYTSTANNSAIQYDPGMPRPDERNKQFTIDVV